MWPRRFIVWATFLALMLVAAPALAQHHRHPQQNDDPAAGAALDAEARAIFQAGRVAYDDGRFGDALGYFRRAYELSHRAELLYNVGSAADKLRLDADALAAFRQYLSELPEAQNRREVEARVAVLERTTNGAATTSAGTTTATGTTGTGTTTGTIGTGATTTGIATTTTGTTVRTTTVDTASTGTVGDTHGTHTDGTVGSEHDLTPAHVAAQDLDHTTDGRPVRHVDDGGVLAQWWFWTLVGVVVAGATVAVVLALTQQPTQATQGLVTGTDGMVHYALTAP